MNINVQWEIQSFLNSHIALLLSSSSSYCHKCNYMTCKELLLSNQMPKFIFLNNYYSLSSHRRSFHSYSYQIHCYTFKPEYEANNSHYTLECHWTLNVTPWPLPVIIVMMWYKMSGENSGVTDSHISSSIYSTLWVRYSNLQLMKLSIGWQSHFALQIHPHKQSCLCCYI